MNSESTMVNLSLNDLVTCKNSNKIRDNPNNSAKSGVKLAISRNKMLLLISSYRNMQLEGAC